MLSKKIAASAIGFSYKNIIKPILFGIDPDIVHDNATHIGELLGDSTLAKHIIRGCLDVDSPMLSQNINGMNFRKPVGLSAGFDYNARLTQILPSLGFGWTSVGTITNNPYEGNPPPMLGRLPQSRSLMVNKGFKNRGASAIAQKLRGFRFEIPVGISIGRTNSPTLHTIRDSIQDIVTAFRIFEKSHVRNSYYELNISCPNLINAKENFYEPKDLSMLLRHIERLHITKPIFIKMPIGKTDDEVMHMMKTIARFHVSGVIFGNLQPNRKDPVLIGSEVSKFDRGNFSGKPTEKRSNELIQLAYRHYDKKLTIIGTGGIFSAEDAYRKIKLGASLVQLITGIVYQGPQLVAEINLRLVDFLKRDGMENISEAVGIENR